MTPADDAAQGATRFGPAAGSFDAVVLAAGKGTRMRSELPKVLHEAAGLPLLEHVLRALRPARPATTVVVVGHGSDAVRGRFAVSGVEFAEQRELLGTGHALLQAAPALTGSRRPLLVLNGDGPLITSTTIAALAAAQADAPGMTLLTCRVSDPKGLGRILRSATGAIVGVVEEKDADETQLANDEINPGIYAFDADVFELCRELSNDNAAGEYYITELLELYLAAGRPVRSITVADETEILAVNDRDELARADEALRARGRDQ